jgi:hypothetical protein
MSDRPRATQAVAVRGEDGSILPLAIVFGVLALALVLTVVAVTSLYLERERLFTVADGAALAGAESFELSAAGATSDGALPQPALTPDRVRAAVDDYLASAASAASNGLEELTVESAGTDDGRSARVRLAATWHPPVVSVFVPAGLRLSVTSTARSVLW